MEVSNFNSLNFKAKIQRQNERRKQEIMPYLDKKMTIKEIAGALNLSYNTVRQFIKRFQLPYCPPKAELVPEKPKFVREAWLKKSWALAKFDGSKLPCKKLSDFSPEQIKAMSQNPSKVF